MADREPTQDAWGDLIRAALAGDAAAYRRLLGEIAPRVRAIVRRALAHGGRGQAEDEDIVQDVLLAVHLKRRTWDPALPFGPWLSAVARHKVIDHLRREGRRPTVPIEDLQEILPDRSQSAPSAGDAERMLAALDARQRAIVQGVTLDGRSAAEVGAALGMSEGAVRVALHRALKTLAARFGRDA